MYRLFLALSLVTATLLPASAEPRTRVVVNGEPAPVFFNDGDSFRVLDGKLEGTKARLMGFNTLESFGPVHQWGDWTHKELYVLAKMATLNGRRGGWRCDSDLDRDTYGRALFDCPQLVLDQLRKGLAHTMTVTAESAAAPLVAALEGLSGLRIVEHRRLDVSGQVDLDPEAVVEEVRTGTGNMVVVVAADGSTEIIPVAD